jgi:hypothetical protein
MYKNDNINNIKFKTQKNDNINDNENYWGMLHSKFLVFIIILSDDSPFYYRWKHDTLPKSCQIWKNSSQNIDADNFRSLT